MTNRPAYVRQLASELEMLSHGASTSWNPAGGAGIPSSRQPSGESNPPHLMFLSEWDAKGDRCLNKWHDLLIGWRGRQTLRPQGMSDRDIVLNDGAGFSAEDVATRFRLTPSLVRRWRREGGVNEQTGRGTTNAERAQAMKDSGMSVRNIAVALGEHPTQVQRWTGKRAA